MITGVHAILYSQEAERAREFFRDVLKLDSVDVGGGWLIFALPPSELAVHPADSPDAAGRHELFLVCDDVQKMVGDLAKKGVTILEPITDQRWGLVTRLRLPSGDEIGLYEPKHPQPMPSGDPKRA